MSTKAPNRIAEPPALVRLDRWGDRMLTLARARAYATIAIILFAVVYGLGIAGHRGLVDRFGHVIGTDFLMLRLAASMIRDGHGERLYDLGLQAAYQRAALAPETVPGMNAFIAPPFVALFFLPWTALPHALGFLMWAVIGVASVVGALRIVARYTPQTSPRLNSVVLLSLSFSPVIEALEGGTNALLSLAVFAAAYAALKEDRDALAGAVLALQLCRPQLLLVPLVVLVFKHRWRALAGFLCGAAVLAVAAELFIAPNALTAWARIAPSLSRMIFEPGMPYAIFCSVYALFQLPLGPEHFAIASVAGTIVSAALIGALLRLCSGAWSPKHAGFDLACAAVLIEAPLVSPYLQLHDLAILIIPAVLLAEHVGRGTLRVAFALVWFACMIGPAVTSRLVRVPLPPLAILAAAGMVLLTVGRGIRSD